MNYIIIKKCEPGFFRDFSVYYGIKIQYNIKRITCTKMDKIGCTITSTKSWKEKKSIEF